MTIQLPQLMPVCEVPKQQFCADCRNKEGGRDLRQHFLTSYNVEGVDVNFECPKRKPWTDPQGKPMPKRIRLSELDQISSTMPDPDAFKQDVLVNLDQKTEQHYYLNHDVYDALIRRHRAGEGPMGVATQPKPTVSRGLTLFEAMMTAGKVPDDIKQERRATCAECEYAKRDPAKKIQFCDICGCGTSANVGRIVNLTSYREGPIVTVTVKGKKMKGPKWGCKHDRRGQLKPGGGTYGWDR